MAASALPEPPSLRHKTLSAYFPRLYTLRALLSFHLPNPDFILLDSDPEEYHRLICTIVCAPAETFDAEVLGTASPIDGTQQAAIDRVLRDLGKGTGTKDGKNVLLSGNRTLTPDLPINTSRPSLENRHVNSPSSALRGLAWKIFRARLGDVAFHHLLVHTSLFVPVGNNCYMQLSGVPLYELYTGRKDQGLGDGKRRKRKRLFDDGRVRKRRRKAAEKGDEGSLDVLRRPNVETAQPDGSSQSAKPRIGPADVLIPRQRMFYGQPARRTDGKLIAGLPPQHQLNRLPRSGPVSSTDRDCLQLLHSIFPSVFGLPSFDAARTTAPDFAQMLSDPRRGGSAHQSRMTAMLGLARELLARHAATDYARLFWRCMQRREKSEDLTPVSHSQFTPKVCRFVGAICQKMFSGRVLGNVHNVQILTRASRRIITAKQYESINLHVWMQDLRVGDVSWLSPAQRSRPSPDESQRSRRLLEELIFWIFTDYLIPLLKNTFYITETAATRYETVYYTHDEWRRASQPYFRLLEEELLEELDSNERYFAMQGPLGVSAVRLIPKPNGFRPIVNLGRKIVSALQSKDSDDLTQQKPQNIPGMSIASYGKAVTANQALRGVHQVLTLEKDRNRASLGSSLFGTNEIFAPLQELKQNLLAKHGKMPRMYFVKMDIKAAFDTIKQDKMLEIVDRLLDRSQEYCIMLYALLLPPASEVSHGSSRRLYKSRAVLNGEQWSTFDQEAKAIARPLRNAVIVDLVRRKQITRDACMSLLQTHIKENVWQVGDKTFRQKTGIPQGSKISSLLCSFFYACLEREHLGWVHQTGSRLLRYIDDFLLISDNFQLAKRFVKTMNAGFPEYGAFVSAGKTLLSFEYATGSQVAPVCGAGDGAQVFPYCGFLIDMRTLAMGMDYPRVMSSRMDQAFAIRFSRRRGAAFVGWLSRQLENRNHVAYLDTLHNDLTTVHFNIFVNFALTAMKIPHYFESGTNLNARQALLVFEAIRLAAEYTYVAGRARVMHAAREDPRKGHYAVRRRDFIFLSLTAVHMVLARKASRFKGTVELVQRYLAGRDYRGLEEWHSAMIQKGWEAVKGARY